MKTLSARIAGLSRLTRIALAAGGALLVIAIIAGVVLTLSSKSSGPSAAFLAGEATADWKTAVKTYYEDLHYSGARCLATTTEYLGQPGKYQVRLWGCTEWQLPANKVWTFVAADALFAQGSFMKSSAGGGEVCLDVEGGEAKDGATVTTFPCKTSNYTHQLWNVNSIDSPGMAKYVIESGRSGFCLAKADSNDAYSWIKLVPCASNAAQTWKF